MELTDFLLARIAEDEAAAKAALKATGNTRWSATQPDSFGSATVTTGQTYVSDYGHTRAHELFSPFEGETDTITDLEVALHVAAWDPVRVLLECGSKRAIVKRFRKAPDAEAGDRPDPVLRLMARPYSSHPDHRGHEWFAGE